MSSPAALLDVDAPHEDALRLMRERGIRRVPLIAGRRVVGMVTLDDLLLERTATLDELVDIVRAQIAEGGPAQTRRFDEWRSLERRYARALTTWKGLVAKLQATSKLETRDRAEKAIELVLGSIVRRVEPAVAKKMIARAPALVQPRLRALPPGPDLSVTRASLEREMAAALDVQRSRGASIVDAVGAVLAGSGSLEASDSIGRHLPLDLRSLLRSRSVKRASVVARRPLHRVASRRARHGAGV
jgi:CBS domain-containing protein